MNRVTVEKTFCSTFNQMKKPKQKTLYFVMICFSIPLGLYLLRQIQLSLLPQDELRMPLTEMSELLEIPPRPGVRGLMISGPRIQPLTFSLDLARSGLKPLNWGQLMLIDPNADVKINGRIDEYGVLHITPEDVLMGGHTEAGIALQSVLKTWLFTPYKTGPIQFWFNLPSKGRKLVIDTRQMNRKSSIPETVPIYIGRLYLVDGLSKQEVTIK